jgi:hypothetical protein
VIVTQSQCEVCAVSLRDVRAAVERMRTRATGGVAQPELAGRRVGRHPGRRRGLRGARLR